MPGPIMPFWPGRAAPSADAAPAAAARLRRPLPPGVNSPAATGPFAPPTTPPPVEL